MATSALEKLRRPSEPHIVTELPPKLSRWGPPGATMVISTPQEIDGLVRGIPKGKVATLSTLRAALAKRHGTDITCPLTTGIFLNIVAFAAAEMEMMGGKRLTPWWRVLKADGALNEKFPGGLAEQAKRLAAEGVLILAKGKNKRVVKDFEQRLARLT